MKKALIEWRTMALLRIAAFQPAPLDRQPVKPDAAMQFSGEEQPKIERPHLAGPDPVRRLERADQRRLGQHVAEMNGGHEEQRKSGQHLYPPQ